MKRIAYVGFSLSLILALALPGIGQQAKSKPEYDTYSAFYSEQNPQKKAELGEKFLADFKDSEYRAPGYQLLVNAYYQAQNWAKVIEVTDRFDQELPNADAKAKAPIYARAMAAAQQTNNFEKTVVYGEKVLAVEPNDVNTQLTLSSVIPERLPSDEAGKKAALDKAFDLATKAKASVDKIFSGPKPANMSDDQWNKEKSNIQAQLHSTLGLIHLNRQEYDQSVEEYGAAVKENAKDGIAQYRLGLAYQGQAGAAGRALQDAVKAENDAKAAKAENVSELVSKREALEKTAREKRDLAIDSLAKAVAIGGVVAQPAREQLERLYKLKNNDSLEGLDQLIAEKKSQLG